MKTFVFQGLKNSDTTFKVDPTKMLARGDKNKINAVHRTIEGKNSSGD